jgi:2,6-dihydroxypseudooxynicotine hydrolase
MGTLKGRQVNENEVAWLWDHYTYRFFAEGAIYRDVLELRDQIKSIDQWCPRWSEAARAAEQKADRALASGFTQTASSDLYRSSLYYFFAQFLLWGFADAKRTAYENCARSFRRASPLLDPPLQPIEIPYRGLQMPGYFRMPTGATKPPCVVLIDGLDTTKEEQLVISTLCIQRGMATLSFDGPGQGEMFYKMKMKPNYVDAVQAALDYAEELAAVDGKRLGVIGRSLGSHYAAKVAALDARVKAAVSWGAMYHLRNYRTIPSNTQAGFMYVTGSKTLEEARPYLESVDLKGLATKITCPLMIVNGGQDPITPPENVALMRTEVKGPTEVLYWQNATHCGHDVPHLCRPAMADFMYQQLVR